VEVEEKEKGEGFSFREYPKERKDESYKGKPRKDKKSKDGYIPPDIIELRK